MRVGLPSLGSSSITLDMWIGPSFSITPPTCSARCAPATWRGRWWRLTIFSPSTYTRSFFGSTRSTLPRLPRSLPPTTITSSSVLIRAGISVLLEDLGGERDDLHEVSFAQLAGHRAEDAGSPWVVLSVDQHRRVLVET